MTRASRADRRGRRRGRGARPLQRGCRPRRDPTQRRAHRSPFPDHRTRALDGRILGRPRRDAGQAARVGRDPGVQRALRDFGWSGHGFKHAPIIGDVLSDVVLGRTCDYNPPGQHHPTRSSDQQSRPAARVARASLLEPLRHLVLHRERLQRPIGLRPKRCRWPRRAAPGVRPHLVHFAQSLLPGRPHRSPADPNGATCER
jgi:hypothetical protein